MSLINEALKKAQKQQSEAAAKGQPGTSIPPPPPPPNSTTRGGNADDPEPESNPVFTARRQRSGKKTPLTLILIAAVLLVGAGGGVWFLLLDDGSHATVALADSPAVDLTEEAAERASASDPGLPEPAPADETMPPEEAPIEATPVITLNLPAVGPGGSESTNPETVAASPVELPPAKSPAASIPPPQPRSAPELEQAREPTIAASTPPIAVDSEPVVSPSVAVSDHRPLQRTPTGKVTIATSEEPTAHGMPKASAGSTTPNASVLNFLERTRVSGIRVSDTDPKVLMNDRVYRLNEIVDRDLQLRVIEINPRELRFQDTHGHVYRKTF